MPTAIRYEVTEFGRSLERILGLVRQWGSAFEARKLAEESAALR